MRLTIPSTIMKLLLNFSFNFSQPTFENFVVLSVGAILTQGARTITGVLKTVKAMCPKHFSTYHRFLSRASYPLLPLARALGTMIFSSLEGTIRLVVDDTLSRHNGPKVFGKSCFLDPLRQIRKARAFIYGHRWVTLSVLVSIPFCSRSWALPILSFFCPSERYCEKHGRKHKTPWELARLAVKLIQRWFPERSFSLSADGAYAVFEFVQFCATRPTLFLFSRLRMNAALYDAPKPQRKKHRGRPFVRGPKQLSPQERVKDENVSWIHATLPWYGGQPKTVLYAEFDSYIYKPKEGLVLIRWVLVKDPTGKGQPEAFFSTDPAHDGPTIIQGFIQRWSIEVTFEEAKHHLAAEKTRNRTRSSVLRSFPLLLGLFTLISWWYYRYLQRCRLRLPKNEWYPKSEPTFSDALFHIRLECWHQNIFSTLPFNTKTNQIQRRFLNSLCDHLAQVV